MPVKITETVISITLVIKWVKIAYFDVYFVKISCYTPYFAITKSACISTTTYFTTLQQQHESQISASSPTWCKTKPGRVESYDAVLTPVWISLTSTQPKRPLSKCIEQKRWASNHLTKRSSIQCHIMKSQLRSAPSSSRFRPLRFLKGQKNQIR